MSAWDQFPSTSGANVILGDGEEFVGTIQSVTPHTFPKGTFNHQNEDLTVPRITFADEGRGEKFLDATATVLRNALVDLSPEPGTRIRIKREGQPQGKSWVGFSVSVVGEAGGSAEVPFATTENTGSKSAGADSPPPF
jgi:hypothetical protein